MQPGSPLAHSESLVFCGAVALLMAALIILGATTEAPRARLTLQTGMLGAAAIPGVIAPAIPAVVLVIGPGLCAFAQTALSHIRVDKGPLEMSPGLNHQINPAGGYDCWVNHFRITTGEHHVR